MNKRVYTAFEILSMSDMHFRMFKLQIEAKAFILLGMDWKKSITYWEDHFGNLHFEWE